MDHTTEPPLNSQYSTVEHASTTPTYLTIVTWPLQVRSCSLDTWLPGQVAFMASTGNAASNSYWAGRRPEAARLPAGSPLLASHIARKVKPAQNAGLRG